MSSWSDRDLRHFTEQILLYYVYGYRTTEGPIVPDEKGVYERKRSPLRLVLRTNVTSFHSESLTERVIVLIIHQSKGTHRGIDTSIL